MGHRRLIRQKEGKQFKWCQLNHLLYPDRTPTFGYLLGEVNLGKFVQGGNARPLCFTLTCTGSGQVLQGEKMVSHSLLWQQSCPWTFLPPQKTHQTQRQVRRYTMQPTCHQTNLYWKLQIHSRIQPHGSISQMGTAHPNTATQLFMWHSCKMSNNNSFSPRLPQQAVSAPFLKKMWHW